MKTLELESGTDSGRAHVGGIVDLVGAGGIEVEVRGVGIAHVRVRLRRLVPATISVHIPLGTTFISKDPAVQDMIGRQAGRATLDDNRWKSVWLEAACANRTKDVPTPGNRFEIVEAPRQQDLKRLAPLLSQAQSSFETQQAAVWIVTDDSSFEELGSLRSRDGSSRLIMPEHAARALQMCLEVGIDIRKRKIWSDRHALVHELPDGGLKEWLRSADPTAGQGFEFFFLDGLRRQFRCLWAWLKQRWPR